jgi:hypothetical protein
MAQGRCVGRAKIIMKTKKPLQIVTVVFALGLLGAYIVYSQNKQTPQTVMPSSKSRVVDGAKQSWPLEAKAATDTATNPPSASEVRDMTVLSSSKVLVPVVSNPPATSQPATYSNPSQTVIGGSKFATVFTPGPSPPTNLSKAVIYGSKSAPAFVPAPAPDPAAAKSNSVPSAAITTNSSASTARKP